jgi:serine/threonine protein kinase
MFHVLRGITELHQLGYVHRDLKPDNVVLSLHPLEVRVIDFDAALLDSQATKGKVRGTHGYFPLKPHWRDGSIRWDVWSFAAMLLEADLDKEEYIHTNNETEARLKLRKHLKKEGVCKHLRAIWEGTMLKKK